MYRIYSRPRVRLPNIFFKFKNKFSKKKNRRIFTLVIIILIAFITAKLIIDAIMPIFNKLCEDKAKSIATIISNNEATKVMSNYTYDDLFIIEKDQNENISMIRANMITINEIISDVAVKIQEELEKEGRNVVEIPLGSFTGINLFAGQGPGVKITITSTGNVETDLKSEFTSQGINQTLHRVYLDVVCEVSILTPFKNITASIKNQVLLLENVIIGHIPDSYYNLDGLTGASDAMELIN